MPITLGSSYGLPKANTKVPILTCSTVETAGSIAFEEANRIIEINKRCYKDNSSVISCLLYEEVLSYWVDYVELFAAYWTENCNKS